MKFFRIFPARAAYFLGHVLARLWCWADRRHQKIALENVRKAYGNQLSAFQSREIVRETYLHLGRSFAELVQATRTDHNLLIRQVRIEGHENLLEAQKKGQGVLYLTAHLGNWELMALAHSLKLSPVTIIARPLNNPLLETVLKRFRLGWGTRIIPKKGALREVLRCLKAGEAIGYMLDQNTAKDQGVFVDFFGRPACTHKALALLAIKTGAPVLPIFIHRGVDGAHHIEIGKPVTVEKTGDRDRDVMVNTQRFTSVIESEIRKYPAQWLWVHRRWKTQPR